MTRSDVLKNPINFLYVFSNASFESLVSKHISKRAAQTIQRKRQNQVKYIDIAYGGSNKRQTAYSELSAAIEQQFGYTPQAILNKLLAGESVAGKNWVQGVFGIGKTKMVVYKDNPNVLVDSDTGRLLNSADDTPIEGGTPIYASNKKGTYVSGYSYQIDGKTYTTLRAKDGKYYASTYGNESGMFDALGNTISAGDTSSVWENIATAMPFVEDLLNWIASLLQGFVPISIKSTVPQQTEFVSDNADGISLSSVGIMAAVAAGGYLLMKK